MNDIGVLGGTDPHEVLGVRRGASPQQVTRAFHREALRGGHPDTGGDARAFRRLVVARDVLLQARPTPGVARPGPSARPATPRPAAPPSAAPQRAPSSDANVLPLILLGLFMLVGVPHVLLALVLLLVP